MKLSDTRNGGLLEILIFLFFIVGFIWMFALATQEGNERSRACEAKGGRIVEGACLKELK
jgi:hypothetical protein